MVNSLLRKEYPVSEGSILGVLVADTRDLFTALYGKVAPNPVVVAFVPERVDGVVWGEVERRSIEYFGKRFMDLAPKLRLNMVLALDEVPDEVAVATILEELIHLHRGWEIKDDHDTVFWGMALKYRFFADSIVFKERSVRLIADAVNQHTLVKMLNSTRRIKTPSTYRASTHRIRPVD